MRYIDIARRHGFGLEDITEDKTGEKPQDITAEADTSEKDAADLAAAAKEGADAAPVGDTTVAAGDGEQQTPEVASSDKSTPVDGGAVASTEDSKADKIKAETSDEKIDAVKKKLDDIADVLDKFAKDNKKDKNEGKDNSTVSNESADTAPDQVDTAAEGAVAEGEAATAEAVPTGDASVPAAPEDVSADANLVISNEGIGGGLLGFILGTIPGISTVGGAAAKAKVEANKKEIERITNEMRRLATYHGRKLVKEGKIKEADLTKYVTKADGMDLVKGAVFGTVFGPLHTMLAGSALEDTDKELKKKVKELQNMVKDIEYSNEEYSTSEDEIKAAVDNGTAEPTSEKEAGILEVNEGEVIPEVSDAEMLSAKEDMEHAGKNLEEAVETIVVMEKTQASVESHYEVVKHCSTRRGIDRQHAVSIGIGLESVLEDFGIEACKIVPSLESFGLEEEKRETTKKLADKLKEVLAAIMRALAKAYEMVITKAKEIVDRAKAWSPGLLAAIKLTKAQLNKSEVKDTVNVSASLRRALHVGKEGNVSFKSLASNQLIDTADIMVEISGNFKEVAGIMKSTLASAMSSSPESAIAALKNSIELNNLGLDPEKGINRAPSDFVVPSGYTLLSSTEELPGGKIILSMAPKKEDGSFDFGKVISGIKAVRPDVSFDEGTVIKGVTKDEVESVISVLEKLVAGVTKIVTSREGAIAVSKGLISAMENYSKSMNKEFKGTEEQAKEIKELLIKNTELSKATIKLTATNVDASIVYLLRSVTAPALDLVRASFVKPVKAD